MAADAKWWSTWVSSHRLFHGTTIERAERILAEGLTPAGSPPSDRGLLRPRPGHVFLADDPVRAAWLRASVSLEGSIAVLEIDGAQLRPDRVNPDEDTLIVPPYVGTNDAPFELLHNEWDGVEFQRADINSLGEFAEAIGYGDDPAHTHWGIEVTGLVSYRGVIPATAITRLASCLADKDSDLPLSGFFELAASLAPISN